jgi:hypothetical protein
VQTWWGDSIHAAALVAAQFGLVIIWAILGAERWTFRWPLALFFGTLLGLLLVRFRFWGDNATALFAVQMLTLAGICAVLRWQGFRLIVPATISTASNLSPQTADMPATQFAVRHVLFWMTLFALICGIVRIVGLPWEQWLDSRYSPWLPFITTGAAVAMALILALWGALGPDRDRRGRIAGLLLIPVAGMLAGLSVWVPWMWRSRIRPWAQQMPWWGVRYWRAFFDSERHLISWVCLAGGMLFAALLFLRALGYRLMKVPGNDLQSQPKT